MHMSAEEFELLVAGALDEIPAELAALIDNCVILVEDYPPPDLPDVLGLYSGIPLTERGRVLHRLAGPDPDLSLSDSGDLRHVRGGHRGSQDHRRTRDRASLRDRTTTASTNSGTTNSG